MNKKQQQFAILGLLLSVTAAILDFAAGNPAVQLQNSMTQYAVMGLEPSNLALPLYILGFSVLFTGILGTTKYSLGRMGVFGSLMTAFGIIMDAIGAMMYQLPSMIFPVMGLLAIGMLTVGTLMIANGIAMVYYSTEAKMRI